MQNNTFSGETPRLKLIVVEEISSTNDYFKSNSSNFKPLPEWTAIMAINQTAGRGQRGNSWLVEPGKNLTFSFLLRPDFLKLEAHFTLNMLISIGLLDWLEELGILAQIKWPNDILIQGKKVAGFLIENSSRAGKITQSIIGIGANINQTQFPPHLVERATSLARYRGRQWPELSELCLSLLKHLHRRISGYRTQEFSNAELLTAYNKRLYRQGVWAPYHDPNTGDFEAKIEKVEADGQLLIGDRNGKMSKYRFKEIEFL